MSDESERVIQIIEALVAKGLRVAGSVSDTVIVDACTFVGAEFEEAFDNDLVVIERDSVPGWFEDDETAHVDDCQAAEPECCCPMLYKQVKTDE